MENPPSEKGIPSVSSEGDDTTPRERRRQKRFRASEGAYAALIRPDHAFDLGKILDICSSGVCLSYLASGEPRKGKTKVKIFDMSDRFIDLGRFRCEIIYDVVVDGSEWNSIVTRRCGVQFADLTPKHLLLLENFIRNSTVEEA